MKQHDDEDWDGMDKKDRVEFFFDKYSHTSFLKCVFYMDGYVDLAKSSDLGVYFCQSKYCGFLVFFVCFFLGDFYYTYS